MFPSQGFFVQINCPDYLSGKCSRVYCHLYHNPKLKCSQNFASSSKSLPSSSVNGYTVPYEKSSGKIQQKQIAPYLPSPSGNVEEEKPYLEKNNSKLQKSTDHPEPLQQETGAAETSSENNSEILQQLISEAVKKVLSENSKLSPDILDQNSIIKSLDTHSIITKAVTELSNKPSNTQTEEVVKEKKPHRLYLPPPGTPSYKPTPISELKCKTSKIEKDTSFSGNEEYTPTTIINKNEISTEGDVTDFSNDEEDEKETRSEFDMLEEVLVERSSDPLRKKAILKRKKALGKLSAAVGSKYSKEKKVKKVTPQNQDSFEYTSNSFRPPSPIFTSSSEANVGIQIPLSFRESNKANVSISSNEENVCSDFSKMREDFELTQKLEEEKKSEEESKKQKTEEGKANEKGVSSAPKAPSHNLLPQIATLSRPNVKSWSPVAKVDSLLSVEKMLEQLDSISSDKRSQYESSLEVSTGIGNQSSKFHSSFGVLSQRSEGISKEIEQISQSPLVDRPLEENEKEPNKTNLSENSGKPSDTGHGKRSHDEDISSDMERKRRKIKKSHHSRRKSKKRKKRYSSSEDESYTSESEEEDSFESSENEQSPEANYSKRSRKHKKRKSKSRSKHKKHKDHKKKSRSRSKSLQRRNSLQTSTENSSDGHNSVKTSCESSVSETKLLLSDSQIKKEKIDVDISIVKIEKETCNQSQTKGETVCISSIEKLNERNSNLIAEKSSANSRQIESLSSVADVAPKKSSPVATVAPATRSMFDIVASSIESSKPKVLKEFSIFENLPKVSPKKVSSHRNSNSDRSSTSSKSKESETKASERKCASSLLSPEMKQNAPETQSPLKKQSSHTSHKNLDNSKTSKGSHSKNKIGSDLDSNELEKQKEKSLQKEKSKSSSLHSKSSSSSHSDKLSSSSSHSKHTSSSSHSKSTSSSSHSKPPSSSSHSKPPSSSSHSKPPSSSSHSKPPSSSSHSKSTSSNSHSKSTSSSSHSKSSSSSVHSKSSSSLHSKSSSSLHGKSSNSSSESKSTSSTQDKSSSGSHSKSTTSTSHSKSSSSSNNKMSSSPNKASSSSHKSSSISKNKASSSSHSKSSSSSRSKSSANTDSKGSKRPGSEPKKSKEKERKEKEGENKRKSQRDSVDEEKLNNNIEDEMDSLFAGSESPIPDLSALDDLPKEDWDQLLSGSIDKIEGSEDSDEADFEPSSFDDADGMDDPKVLEECMRVFSEYTPEPNAPPVVSSRKTAKVDDDKVVVPPHKARVAYSGAVGNLVAKPKALIKPRRKTPAEVMLERYKRLKEEEQVLQRKLEQQRKELERHGTAPPSAGAPVISSSSVSSTSDAFAPKVSSSTGFPKKRVARAPSYVSALLKSKAELKALSAKKQLASASAVKKPEPQTLAMTNAKGSKRVAHIPKMESLERPIVSTEEGTKVPQNIRQRYLNCFIDETLKFCDGEEHAYNVALAEESICHKRATTRMVYLNLAVNVLKRLRTGTISEAATELLESDPKYKNTKLKTVSACPSVSSSSKKRFEHPTNPNHRTVSHFAVMASGGQKGTWSIQNKKSLPDNINEFFSGAKFYKCLTKYILSVETLEENCFPRPDPSIKGKAILKKVNNRKKVSPNELERYCDRCSTLYEVDQWGLPVTSSSCVYHWGRAYKRRVYGGFEARYSCCQGDSESGGCCLGTTHVSENFSPDSLRGYVRTIPKDPGPDGFYGIYALDCEMCYTTAGNELTRITVVDTENKTVYESFVVPDNPIIDYNTRFSGITAEDLQGVTVSLRDVQAALLTRFSEKTILMGHSLESDFSALKLIHDTVVDTSVVFPHKLGPPFKRALRNLASEILTKIIQNDEGGHDSAEDAITCMQLMQWRVKEDLKGQF